MSNMTPREQIEKASKKYFDDYLNGLKGDTLTVTDTHKAGAEYGYNLAIENVVEWLCMNMTDALYLGAITKMTMSKPELINNLKQAMKL